VRYRPVQYDPGPTHLLLMIMLSAEFRVNSYTVPCGTPSCTDISAAGWWVGPMIKFPSAFAGGLLPSGNSIAETYPGM
jgi:hypothetical protein